MFRLLIAGLMALSALAASLPAGPPPRRPLPTVLVYVSGTISLEPRYCPGLPVQGGYVEVNLFRQTFPNPKLRVPVYVPISLAAGRASLKPVSSKTWSYGALFELDDRLL